MRDTQMASTTEYEDERVNLSKDAPKQARPRKKILVPPKPHEKRYSSFNKPQIRSIRKRRVLIPTRATVFSRSAA